MEPNKIRAIPKVFSVAAQRLCDQFYAADYNTASGSQGETEGIAVFLAEIGETDEGAFVLGQYI